MKYPIFQLHGHVNQWITNANLQVDGVDGGDGRGGGGGARGGKSRTPKKNRDNENLEQKEEENAATPSVPDNLTNVSKLMRCDVQVNGSDQLIVDSFVDDSSRRSTTPLSSLSNETATGAPLSTSSTSSSSSSSSNYRKARPTSSVSWNRFTREPLTERDSFSFWEWFYGTMRLVKEHLKGPWNDGHILGFLSKEDAAQKLIGKRDGTFLLRFSQSMKGLRIV